MLIAVIGCGSIGVRHLRNLMMMGQENLIAVDTSAARLTDARAQVDNLRIYSSVERALEDKPQAAIIATPPATHGEIACEFIQNGIPVLIEKPLAYFKGISSPSVVFVAAILFSFLQERMVIKNIASTIFFKSLFYKFKNKII